MELGTTATRNADRLMRRKTDGVRDATRERTNGVIAALESTTDLGLA